MKGFITSCLILCSLTLFSQKDFKGIAVYQSKTSMDFKDAPRDMSEQRKKQMQERMKQRLNKTFILHFTKTTSLYKEEEALDSPGKRGGRFGGFSSGIQYKNLAQQEFLEQTELFGKPFLITDDSTMPQWKLTGDTKQIGQYTCYKATLIKQVVFDLTRMRPPRPRGNDKKEDETTQPKDIMVTAWYTPQIPVSNGPGEYWGLPGLILEVNTDKTTILCTQITLNPKTPITIKPLKKGKAITREEYNALAIEKMKEMRERFRGRRGRRR